MYDPTRIYGFDIESLNDQNRGFNGLDPFNSRVTEIAVATDESLHGGGEVFTGPETRLLAEFGRFVTQLPPGLMAGWNSAFFDIPFIVVRENETHTWGSGMHAIPQPGLRPKYDALPGAVTKANPGGGYTAVWQMGPDQFHSHLDVAQAYRRYADTTIDPATGQPVKWGLKPVCTSLGIDMITEDRENLHTISAARRAAYNLSDSAGTRELALRLLGLDYTPYGIA